MSSLPTNHLIHEKSPYLLQHAHNPVDWYPWGEEAFALARELNKPIFLSIGYATCHWCHVMERESFENEEVARLMNALFVNIKVDREELPHVDNLYMEFAQALMSSPGGWPLNILLTPDLKPFFAATYMPPKGKRGLIGMVEFMEQIKSLWEGEERTRLDEQANHIVEIFEKSATTKGEELPDDTYLFNAAQVIFNLADGVDGGLKGAPKFPIGYQADFLLSYAKLKNESRALYYVELTLDKMSMGGIYDHLGGGFSRYSVDEKWMVPHFEKMLYDNALLACAYLSAWKYTKKPRYKQVCTETLDYLLRVMVHEEGGFYSAEDADTHGHEGLFYTWTWNEIHSLLSKEDALLFCMFYNVTEGGNFEGRSVLHIEVPEEEFAKEMEIDPNDLAKILENGKKVLFEAREKRDHPFKDDKILSSWNGLTIAVLAEAGSAFKEKKYTESALKAARFIKNSLWKEGRLLRRYREGDARFTAGLDEYAFLIKGVLSLFEAGLGTEWLEWALEMAQITEKTFKVEEGAFYHTSQEDTILLRKCDFYDGAEPSGNGVHAENLIRLYQITFEEKYLSQAEDIFRAAKSFMQAYPLGVCYHLIALQRYFDLKASTIVIALDEKRSLENELKELLNTHFSPHSVVIWKDVKDAALIKCVPAIDDKYPIDNQTAVYICRREHCEAPLIKKEDIVKAIKTM